MTARTHAHLETSSGFRGIASLNATPDAPKRFMRSQRRRMQLEQIDQMDIDTIRDCTENFRQRFR
jgi:hypothetical protein